MKHFDSVSKIFYVSHSRRFSFPFTEGGAIASSPSAWVVLSQISRPRLNDALFRTTVGVRSLSSKICAQNFQMSYRILVCIDAGAIAFSIFTSTNCCFLRCPPGVHRNANLYPCPQISTANQPTKRQISSFKSTPTLQSVRPSAPAARVLSNEQTCFSRKRVRESKRSEDPCLPQNPAFTTTLSHHHLYPLALVLMKGFRNKRPLPG